MSKRELVYEKNFSFYCVDVGNYVNVTLHTLAQIDEIPQAFKEADDNGSTSAYKCKYSSIINKYSDVFSKVCNCDMIKQLRIKPKAQSVEKPKAISSERFDSIVSSVKPQVPVVQDNGYDY